jgi:two-component system chemotaxis response regulator CheB
MTVTDGNYRCRVGHAWTSEALLAARDDEVEGAVWVALRSLKEKADLARRLAEKLGSGVTGDRYTRIADESERAMLILGKRLVDTAPESGRNDGG